MANYHKILESRQKNFEEVRERLASKIQIAHENERRALEIAAA